MLYESFDGTPGFVGFIDDSNIGMFGRFIPGDVRDAIKRGEPIAAFGWTVEQIAAGALCGTVRNGVFEIVSLYVAPSYRKMGGGRFLLEMALTIAEDYVKEVRIDYLEEDEEHTLLTEFLEHMEFDSVDDDIEATYVTTINDVSMEKLFKKDEGFLSKSFSEADPLVLRKVESVVKKSLEPISEGGFSSDEVDSEVSRFIGNADKYAYAVVEKLGDGSIMLSAVVNDTDKPENVMLLLADAFKAARSRYSPDTKLYISVINDISRRLVENILPSAKRINRAFERTIIV